MRLSMLTNRKRIHVSSFGLFFGRKEDGGNSGYEFPCNANGFILGDQYQTAAQRNESAKLLRGDSAYLPAVIVEHKHSYMEPATGRCSCGRTVTLSDGLENWCDCGACYNVEKAVEKFNNK